MPNYIIYTPPISKTNVLIYVIQKRIVVLNNSIVLTVVFMGTLSSLSFLRVNIKTTGSAGIRDRRERVELYMCAMLKMQLLSLLNTTLDIMTNIAPIPQAVHARKQMRRCILFSLVPILTIRHHPP